MNYFCFGGWPKLQYAYIDSQNYLADSLFCKYEVTVDFGDEYYRDDTEYRVIFCKIKKKDKEKFEKALSELNNKMLLCGRNNYEEFCDSFIKELADDESIRVDT